MPMDSTDSGFVFTAEDNRTSNLLWASASGVGCGLCFLTLCVIAVAMYHPASKHQLDRVSFRIMIYALVANMIFGMASTINALQTQGGASCGFFMWLLMLTLEISTFLLFSIALNLQLVLVHGINGQMMEKYYVGGSILAALAISVPPYASKQYGWDPLNQACWYTADNTASRLRWQIGTQIVWSVVCAFGEIVSFFTVLTYMLRHQVLHGKAIRSRSQSLGSKSRPRAASISTATNGPAPATVSHAKTYQSVIARISLYPLASLIINSVTVASDLYQTLSDGVKSPTDYRVLLLNDFCYGGRPMVYALLAATDPSLLRALKTLWRYYRGQKDDTTGDSSGPATAGTHGTTTSNGKLTVHIELNEVRQLDDGTELPSTPGTLKSPSEGDLANLKEYDKDGTIHVVGTMMDDERTARLDQLRRGQIGRAMEMRQEALDRKQERKDFKKQI